MTSYVIKRSLWITCFMISPWNFVATILKMLNCLSFWMIGDSEDQPIQNGGWTSRIFYKVVTKNTIFVWTFWLREIAGTMLQFELLQVSSANLHNRRLRNVRKSTLPRTNSSPLKIGRNFKGNDRIPNIHLRCENISFREGGICFFLHDQPKQCNP